MSSQTAVQIPALDFATVKLGTMAWQAFKKGGVVSLQACQASQAAANVPCQA